uniref:NADH dehydrogenase [ubiquinone] 1 alpha subcomplex subunit n=1 Tax=Talaromyces marneffei PM1 TaxID=1077442 RepID=A0A093UVP1_TALMA
MSTLTRTFRNLWRIGFKEYGHQMQYIGDTKAGTLIATDRFGNKYYENMEELPLRTRWVDYKEKEFDAAQIEPGTHGWPTWLTLPRLPTSFYGPACARGNCQSTAAT